MVIPALNERGMESLHVQVVHVAPQSAARRLGVTSQMFLKSMALVDKHGPKEHVLIGATNCRDRNRQRDTNDRAGDIWRGDTSPPDGNVINLQALIKLVDVVMGTAVRRKYKVQVCLLHYK